jgi:hypothetical protein
MAQAIAARIEPMNPAARNRIARTPMAAIRGVGGGRWLGLEVEGGASISNL